MANSEEAFEKFMTTFGPQDGRGPVDRMEAVRAGTELIRGIADSEKPLAFEVRAALIQAVGTMVGHYVGAQQQVELSNRNGAPLRIGGINPPMIPANLQVTFALKSPNSFE